METSLILTILIIIVFAIYYQIRKYLVYWGDRNVLVIKPSFPMGNLSGVGTTKMFNDVLKEVYDKFVGRDKFCGFYFMMSPQVLVLDLDLVKQILIKDFHHFADRKMYYNLKDDPLSGHLFNLRGAKWRLLRQQLSPTFTSGKMKMMFDLVANGSKDLLKYVDRKTNTDIDVKDMSIRYVADVIGTCAFGLECNALENDEAEIIKKALKIFEMNSLKFFFVSTFQDLSRSLGMRLFNKEGTDYFMSVIENTVKSREENSIIRKDFMNILIELKNHGKIMDDKESEDLGKITFEELAAQAFLFMLAGFETTSTTMQFILGELAINQEIQDKTRDEIIKIKEKYDGKFTYDSMNELEYLNMVINETMRKWPAVGLLMRITLKEYKVPDSNHIIEKDTPILVPVWAIHRDPKIYPDPEKFDPDRFLPENVHKRHPMAFQAFGDGPRNCIGMRFAYLQMKLGLAELLSTYRFKLAPRTKVPFEINPKELFLNVKSGIHLQAERL